MSQPFDSGWQDCQRSAGDDPPLIPRRIALVLSGLAAGGTERVVCSLATHWARAGRQVHVISLDDEGTPSYYHYPPEVEIVRLGLAPRPRPPLSAALAIFRRAKAIRRALKAISPDIALSFLTRQNVLTLAATAGMRLPVIVSERSNPDRQHPGAVWDWLRSALYPRAQRLVVMTEGARACFGPRLAGMASIVPNPVVLPTGWTCRRNGSRVVAVGRLEPVKGFDLLIRTFAGIAPAHPDWTLTIWGEGPERANLERIRTELGLDDRVSLPGVTSTPGAWIETADVFVLTSHYEGWPNALAEAMAAGIPVVALDCPHGPSEMIRHRQTGLLVSPVEPGRLREALDEILADHALRETLGTAAAISASRFRPDQVMAGWDAVVASAMARLQANIRHRPGRDRRPELTAGLAEP